jgi:L-rhamnose mutarotase
MDLKNDSALIAEYEVRHSQPEIWPEVLEGMKQVGILEMEIYRWENKLFMIVETPVDFNWDTAMAKLATLPRQQEWEDYMSIFQQCKEGDTAEDKWKMMPRIFHIYD